MTEHVLKTWPGPFGALASRAKSYEIRRQDRPFKVGDTLRLQEWDPFQKEYTGRELLARVTYMTEGGEWGLPLDLCVMSLANVREPATACCAVCNEILTGAWFVTRGIAFCSIEHEKQYLAAPIRSVDQKEK